MNIRIAPPLGWLSLVAMLFALVMPLLSQAEEKESESSEEVITFEQLPKRVREAVKMATSGGEIEKIEKEISNGKTAYDVEVEVEGGTVELTYNDKGQLIGIEVADTDNGDNDDEGDDRDDDRDDDGDDDGDDKHHAEAGKKGVEKSSAKGDDDEGDDDEGEDDDAEESAGEVSKNISIDQVQQAARAAIGKRAGDTKLVGVESITEAGTTVYKAAWMKGDVKREVTVSVSGAVISEESSLSLAKLPRSLQALANKFAGGAELKLERKNVVLYELEVVKNGKSVEVCVDATGRRVSIELGDDDNEHASSDDDGDDDEDDDEHEDDSDQKDE